MLSFHYLRSQNQDSLMKLLLNTPATQTQLLRWILEQLALISLDEEEMLQSQHSQIPRFSSRSLLEFVSEYFDFVSI